MIKKIVHLADLHIRTFSMHEMYKKQFELLIEDLKPRLEGYLHDEIRIVIAGDVAHQKINISNEQIILTSWFFSELAKIGKVVIIPGNHDFLENNVQRLDSISPIVELLSSEHIVYHKDTGVYADNNIKWVVYSLYQHNKRPEFEKDEALHVGIFHGPIQGMSTDTGFEFDDAYDRLNFVGLDLLLCGDIHKRQQFTLPGGGIAMMIGSLVQQNFGETVNYHGYGIYDVQSNSYEAHDIENEQPFLHFSISDFSDIENGTETLLNIR
jgi:DNA repair exonuclease SbcCD nuclease subunit